MYFLIFLLVSAGFLEHMKLSRSCFKTLQTLRLSVLQQARCMDSCNSPLNINTCILFAGQTVYFSQAFLHICENKRHSQKYLKLTLPFHLQIIHIYVYVFILYYFILFFFCKHVLSYFSEASVQ